MTSLLTTVLLALVAADSLVLESGYEGCGAARYNRWLYEHVREYPQLKPVYVQIDSEVKGDSRAYAYYVSFLDDSGVVVKQRALAGRREPPLGGSIYARRSADGAWLFVMLAGTGPTTVYDRRGDTAFVSAEGDISGGGGRFIRQFVDDEGVVDRGYFEMLDRHGSVIESIGGGTLGEGSLVRTWPLAYSDDTAYALYSDPLVLVVDKKGRITWRAVAGYLASIALSASGRTVVFATPESAVIRDMKAGSNAVVKFADARILDSLRAAGSRATPPGYFAMPLVAVSRDGGAVAVLRRHNMGGTGGAGQLIAYSRDGSLRGQALALTPGFSTALGFVGDRVAIVADTFSGYGSPAPTATGQLRPQPPPKYHGRLVTLVGRDGEISSASVVSERDATPRFFDEGIAFYGDSLTTVYRVRTVTAEEKK